MSEPTSARARRPCHSGPSSDEQKKTKVTKSPAIFVPLVAFCSSGFLEHFHDPFSHKEAQNIGGFGANLPRGYSRTHVWIGTIEPKAETQKH